MSILRPNRRKDRNKDPLGKRFMEWVRGWPCLICAKLRSPQQSQTEFAHIGGNLAAKVSNFRGIPLCRQHHRDSAHSQENLKGAFGHHWGVDVEGAITFYNQEFERLNP